MPYIARTHRFLNKHLRPATYSHNLFARDPHAHVVRTAVRGTAGFSVYRLDQSASKCIVGVPCDPDRIARRISDGDLSRVNIPPDLT